MHAFDSVVNASVSFCKTSPQTGKPVFWNYELPKDKKAGGISDCVLNMMF